MRWQQLTGAIMAKGYEDTVLYNFNRLVSLNEVGGDPATEGISMAEFHRWNITRLRRWPNTLNTTSTHDTKRSQDVRARIAVLSEIPDEWEKHLRLWMRLNIDKKRTVNGRLGPEPNAEVLLYQTLIGAWPLENGRALVGYSVELESGRTIPKFAEERLAQHGLMRVMEALKKRIG